ncbi:MAG: histidine phosphatase family protein [Thermodesulfobacteriota bacterium]
MSILYCIRHGQASFGKNDYDLLSDKGRQQSRVVAEYFFSLGTVFDTVFTGTLRRQIETARELTELYRRKGMPQPEVKTAPSFNEYDSEGIFKKLLPLLMQEDEELGGQIAQTAGDKRAFQFVFERIMQHWISGTYSVAGLETWEEFKGRVNEAIDGIMADEERGKCVAVFTSGGPICLAAQKALHLSDADALRLNWQVANASITRFQYAPGRIMLSTFNEYGHLESNPGAGMVTYR